MHYQDLCNLMQKPYLMSLRRGRVVKRDAHARSIVFLRGKAMQCKNMQFDVRVNESPTARKWFLQVRQGRR